MIAVGIITAPRGKPTLAQSYHSYQGAGFQYLTHVFAEPGSQDVPMAANVRVYRNAERKGNFRNWVWALGQLLITDEPWVMICEDDIRWAHGAAAILENDISVWLDRNNPGAVSLYLPIRMSKVLEQHNGTPLKRGWYPLNLGRKTWGAQCLLFRRTWAEALLQELAPFVADPKWDKNVDALVAEALVNCGRTILYRVPCLVDHTFGDGNSSLGYKPDRPDLKTIYFEGVQ